MKYKILLSTFLLLVVAGCSSLPPPGQTSTAPPEPISSANKTEAQTSVEGQQEVSQKAQMLSQGKEVSIATSQGEMSVAPTVIAVANPERAESTAVLSQPQYNDPWESFNRSMFAFNHAAYEYVLIPVTDGYRAVLPQPVRSSVGNFFCKPA